MWVRSLRSRTIPQGVRQERLDLLLEHCRDVSSQPAAAHDDRRLIRGVNARPQARRGNARGTRRHGIISAETSEVRTRLVSRTLPSRKRTASSKFKTYAYSSRAKLPGNFIVSRISLKYIRDPFDDPPEHLKQSTASAVEISFYKELFRAYRSCLIIADLSCSPAIASFRAQAGYLIRRPRGSAAASKSPRSEVR